MLQTSVDYEMQALRLPFAAPGWVATWAAVSGPAQSLEPAPDFKTKSLPRKLALHFPDGSE